MSDWGDKGGHRPALTREEWEKSVAYVLNLFKKDEEPYRPETWGLQDIIPQTSDPHRED